MTALIEAHRLSVRAAGSLLLEAVEFAVAAGELVLLAGPNGAGKTTLLKALLGLMPATGEICRKPGLRLAYVPQHLGRDLSLPMTVRRFVSLFAADDTAAAAALARTGAQSLAAKQLASLSGGEMARVQLARALARAPELLVLDEPFAGLDAAGEEALLELIAGLRAEQGCGIVLVSHDLETVLPDVSRIVLLDRRVVCDGTPEALRGHPAMRRLLGGHRHG